MVFSLKILVWQPAANWLVLRILPLEKHTGPLQVSKGHVSMLRGEHCLLGGEHSAKETTSASLQPSGTAGADRHCGKWPVAGVRRKAWHSHAYLFNIRGQPSLHWWRPGRNQVIPKGGNIAEWFRNTLTEFKFYSLCEPGQVTEASCVSVSPHIKWGQ